MLLRTENLTKRFGGLTAVDDVTLDVAQGELRSVIGPNGAGKTTFFNLITGLLQPTSGEVLLNQDSIVGLKPHERVGRGISRSFQITNIFPELSIRKNIRISLQNERGYGRNFWSRVDDIPELETETDRIIQRVGIESPPETEAASMSHGEKRRLEIGIAIAQDPDLLLLDEPAAGMSEEETREIVALIRDLNERYTILLIEHDIDLVMELSDQITVLSEGAIIADGTPAQVTANDRVQEAYLGGHA